MKKFFTLLFSAACLAATAQVPFQPTSLVVYRSGDGAAPLRGVSTKVFLDEFSPSGTLIQSIEMPANAATVSLTASGTATSEGLLTRSVDGQFLMLTGYNTDTGYLNIKASSGSLVKRVIARVDPSAAINISTQLSSSTFSGNNIRAAVSTDGSNYYASGANTGIHYGLLGDSSLRITSATTTENFRGIGIFNGQLYATSTSGTTKGVIAIGTGLPTDSSNAALTVLPGTSAATSPYQFFFADLSPTIPGVDVLYIADDGAATGIQKYSFDGTNWVADGNALPTVTGTRGLTATVTGGVVTLYVTSGGTKLYSLVDATGYNGTIPTAFTELATAPTNTGFRGVALAPQLAIAPLKLISFKAALSADGAMLNWTSANETNVKDFTIERSKNGTEYAPIGSTPAQNKSEARYAFTDKLPLEGINYYRLTMRDNDGTFKYSTITTIVNKRSVKAEVFPNPAVNTIMISHSKAVSGSTITITTAGGQEVQSYTVQTGAVQTSIAVDKLVRGHYIVIYNNNGEKAVTRFMKQ